MEFDAAGDYVKVAVIGSRSLTVDDLEKYLPAETKEIVSGGARGIDQCAKRYASENGLQFTEFLPDYDRYGRRAPLMRNLEIVEYADLVLAFWDGKSRGTEYVIRRCREKKAPYQVFMKRHSDGD